jgi:hypothetical protein
MDDYLFETFIRLGPDLTPEQCQDQLERLIEIAALDLVDLELLLASGNFTPLVVDVLEQYCFWARLNG